MMAWHAQAAMWLQQAAGAFPDTIVTKQVAPDQGWFGTVTSIASGLVSIALVVLAAALVPAAWNFRNAYKRINELLDRIYGDVHPIVRHAHSITDNIDYITTSIRVDVEQVNRTIAAANERLTHALAVSEQRVNELNALLQIVQEEAESTFVSTASTLRGVRASASAFREEAGGESEPGERYFDDQEEANGDDIPPIDERSPGGGSGPRIRPRSRPR